MKHQGTWVLKQWQSSISEGEMNTPTLANGASLVLGAVLYATARVCNRFYWSSLLYTVLRVLIGQSLLSRLGETVYSSSLFTGFSSQFRSTDGFSSYSYEDTKRKRPSSYAHQKPLEGEFIEGQYESKDDPQK